MALDEATTAFLGRMASSGGEPLHEMSPVEARVLGAALREMYGPGPEVGSITEDTVPVDGGQITVRIFTPREPARALIVYYHGGGWVVGTLDDFDPLARELADRARAAVVLVDYRLAPEHRFPTALDDAWAALRWVDERREQIAGGPVPLVVAGDSAGGNLAAVVAQRAKAADGPDLALQVLVYPVTDADFETASYLDPQNQLMIDREAMIWFWDHYAPDLGDRRHPELSPLGASDLSDLPPAVVLTAEHDVVRDEGEAYADRLARAGVPVHLRRWPGQMHGFFQMVNLLPGAVDGVAHVAAEIDRQLTADVGAAV
ncbi:acetyl esterase [Pseudonocardia hierapolitana]|uniref:Acetyl esterase n=1 Tax=Pseudonocardia hierapolitana TaxID=1128676 RepID=A0A561SQU5_9PSEU|nr:alpha/beta hydrolase [Pseudonocardia hierapolitana]TWF77244.1 acetyl esterase [Pseudonocardia hierapolitana]